MNTRSLLVQLWQSQRRVMMMLCVLLVLNIALFFAVERLLVPRVLEQESLYLKRQNELRDLLHKKGGAANSPEQLYLLASQDVARFRQAVPEYQDFTALIEELLVLANRSRLDIKQVSYTSEELKGIPLLQSNLSFNVVGDYEKIKRFVHSLEQSVRLIIIRQISLQGTDDDDVNLRLSLETFFRPGGQET